LKKYRTLEVFMDICVRCGACADKCHFFIGSGDPKNMPVLRAELLRSIYRQDFTTAGRILGSLAGGRELTEEVLKEWYYYFFQCTECRRCSVYCRSQHQLDPGAGRQLPTHRQPSRHPTPHLQG
jgi:Fe-S oxidoreductase